MHDSSNGRLVSFLLEGDEKVACEICLEDFEPISRPPKILPCGHNFCSQCLFSLCCHQEYYLLDNINCPTCRRSFSTKTAKRAPTNYDLCKILESVKKGRELNNITVIHVSGFEEKLDASKSKGKKWQSTDVDRERRMNSSIIFEDMKKLVGGIRREKIAVKRCDDCKRKITTKNLAKLARHCEDCSTSNSVNFACLECCVNMHNGHSLLSIQQLVMLKDEMLREVREIRSKMIEAGELFESRLAELRAAGGISDASALVAAKQTALTEGLAAIDATASRLEQKKLLPTPILRSIREAQYSHYTRVSQLSTRLEKSIVLPMEESPSNYKKGLGRMPSFIAASTSHIRQMKLTVRGDDSLAREALQTVANVMPHGPESIRLAEIMLSFSHRDTVEQRKQLYLEASTLMTQLLASDCSGRVIEMLKEAFLNVFYQLHVLSRRKNEFGMDKKITRSDIWRSVVTAYTELLRIASKQFAAAHPDRIDVVDDLAYLCNLFADVCDQTTVTLCMIEAARARASESVLDESQKALARERLHQIDEHLRECRSVQKLHQLRSTKVRGHGLKGLFSCFRPSNARA